MINPNDSSFNAAYALQGKTLETGWEVIELVKSKPHSTGGNFSVGYLAKKNGKIGFLKALNFLSFFGDDSPDFTEALEEMLASFNYEKEILIRCKDKKLSKVSQLLEAGIEKMPGFLISQVPYLILEKAESDVREHLQFSKNVSIAWKLRSIHNIAVGLQQLHKSQISHQDVKPSNVFVYSKMVSKIGDLGRSICSEIEAPHDGTHFAGDPYYLPPEVIFKFILPDWDERNFSIDLYLLGSLILFYFTGLNATTLLGKNLAPSLSWPSYKGKFNEILPYLTESFERTLEEFKEQINHLEFKNDLIEVIKMLANPDPRLRGDSKYRLLGNNRYDLTTIITKLDVIVRKAELKLL